MKIVLAILAMAFATLTWQPALGAEDSPDDTSEPTNKEIQDSINALSATVANLATLAGTLATSLQSLTAKVDSHASRGEQMAIFMTDPSTSPAGLYHIGQSTIPGFPPGPKSSEGRITQPSTVGANPAMVLPAGSYLIELQQPRTDNVACIRTVAQRRGIPMGAKFSHLRQFICPSIALYLSGNRGRLGVLKDGAGIYTTDGTESFWVGNSFPTGFTFTTEKPRSAYVGAVKVTKIK